MTDSSIRWDHEFDVVVVGSGAGALASSIRAHDLGLKTLVIEKTDRYGGTSAISGGGIWIPNNHQLFDMGQTDSEEAGVRYIKSVIGDPRNDGRIEAYVANGHRMVKYFEENTRLKFEAQAAYTDYYPDVEGSMPGYRSMDPLPYDARDLGDTFLKQRPPSKGTLMLGKMSMSMKEARMMLTQSPGWMATSMKVIARYCLDMSARLKGLPDRHLTLGPALVAALRDSMKDRDIPLWLSTSMEDLIHEGGRVMGVKAVQSGKTVYIKAAKGVILGAGGFEHSREMRAKYHPQPSRPEWTATPAGINTGDAIQAGLRLGAEISNMAHSWWSPTAMQDGEPQARTLFVERALPGCVMVNSAGKRFVNEAAPYSDIVDAMYGEHKGSVTAVPCWFIFDAGFRAKYPAGAVLPGYAQPDFTLTGSLKNYLVKASSLEELAVKTGIDRDGLLATVKQFNGYAEDGKDPEFKKGDSLFDRYYGEPTHQPNPCLGPVAKGPFYALKMFAGDIGTKGGLYTNVNAQVLKPTGGVIEGLYAIGNTSASVMEQTYPGAGSTLGPAMTFGFLAAEHIRGSGQNNNNETLSTANKEKEQRDAANA